MPDHEPLDPNVPHPDIPDIRVHEGSICEIGGMLFLAGFGAGYDHAQQELLPHEAAHEQTNAAMTRLCDDPQFMEEVHDAVHEVIDRFGRQIAERLREPGGDDGR
ncbi:hypothetical protein SEA_DEXDERT_65 [Gordonia phage Dexdert]|uniref:Uncharacterized protein n=1 Tax=Gordonia phage Dexdert TaxID=2794946 RepID=A0A7T1NW79_9CAUD|nr:hypothetical protein J1597_gp65 [Gordonia phage Dexdert]QPO17061.1 hypothetical protein SEA_DEXDERT_65 [Gordonia phage Dexdert]